MPAGMKCPLMWMQSEISSLHVKLKHYNYEITMSYRYKTCTSASFHVEHPLSLIS